MCTSFASSHKRWLPLIIAYSHLETGRTFGTMGNKDFKKGAWTQEEDALLRRCIEIHGEGKWHLVSERAGLNRCRKSCRLRWVNYLDPNVNREKFEQDEIDLIIRMHRLLGNRWSLIAGRIPGRTANDIKNYFNTHLRKMPEPQSKEEKEEEEEEESAEEQKAERHRVIRPIPRFPTTVIGSVIRPVPMFPTTVIATGGPLIVSENRHHKLHHRQLPAPHEENDEHTISGNQQHQLHPEQLLPLAEQNDDPVIHNDEHSVWWNDIFKFLELEGVEYMNQNPRFITNAGESSRNAGTGTEEKETTMFYDSNTGWRHLLGHDLLDGA